MPPPSSSPLTDPATAVRRAMRRVSRHKFVPPASRLLAWTDAPLPIGWGQTTSQPELIAYMLQHLNLHPGERRSAARTVLEVGTGSGYVTAILAELGDVEVYSVEIIPELAERAGRRLRAMGYAQIHLKQGDGRLGWPEHAPYDAIVVTAAPDHCPAPLLEQLADGGRLIIPIGLPEGPQTLWEFLRQGDEVRSRPLLSVMFVPLLQSG